MWYKITFDQKPRNFCHSVIQSNSGCLLLSGNIETQAHQDYKTTTQSDGTMTRWAAQQVVHTLRRHDDKMGSPTSSAHSQTALWQDGQPDK